MMERRRRFILFLAATALISTLFIKGHAPSRQDGHVAFLPFTSSGVTVRVRGAVPAPGVYSLPVGATVQDVIKLTESAPAAGRPAEAPLDNRLRSGDVVEVAGENPRDPAISLNSMKAGEQMLLGIPLHPDQMEIEDWESLPGIGPKLAKNIVADRQEYGDFRSVDAVRRVPGMGEKKLDMIRKYF